MCLETVDCFELWNAWCRMLSAQSWDYFTTHTFRNDKYCPSACIYLFKEWLNRWEEYTAIRRGVAFWPANTGNNHLRGPWANSRKKGRKSALPLWFVAVESHQKGDMHLHSLIKCSEQLSNLDPKDGERIWTGSKNNGGMNMGIIDIQIPRSEDSVQGYVTKDILFDGHFELSRNFISAKPQLRVRRGVSF